MATAPEALVELIGNAARAAQSAAEAAQLMKEASEAKSRNNFSEASKVVKCPEFFGYPTADEDQNTWRDFSFAFKAWLVFAYSNYEDEMKQLRTLLTRSIVCQQMRKPFNDLTSFMLF